MLSTRLAAGIAAAGLTAILLTGCSSSHSSTDGSSESASDQTSPAATKVLREHDKQTIRVVKLLSPTSVLATPTEKTDAEYGETFTVDLVDLVAPTEGTCGYDASLAEAADLMSEVKTWLIRYPNDAQTLAVDEDGVHHAYFDSLGATYAENMISTGMARASDYNTGDSSFQDAAKSQNAGLWASCPDFAA